MHELSIAQSILTIAEEAIPKDNKGVVSSIGIEIGELSGIEVDALQFALGIIKQDTILQNADLQVEIIKGEGECAACKTIFPVSSYGTCCPTCAGYTMTILKGKELRVRNIIIKE